MQQQKTGLAVLLANPVQAHGLPERATGIGHSDEVNDLIDVERVISGEIRLHRQTVDMAAAVRTAVARFTCDARLKRSIEVTTEPAWVDVDPMRLAQVLTNIVANAVEYTQPGGHIRVSLRADGNDAVVTIEDTGLGIPAGLLPFVFDQYVQADRTPDHTQAGPGIGLTLVRQLVELHGGTVVAASAGEGRGSTFTVRLAQVSPLRESTSGSGCPDEQLPFARRPVIGDPLLAHRTEICRDHAPRPRYSYGEGDRADGNDDDDRQQHKCVGPLVYRPWP